MCASVCVCVCVCVCVTVSFSFCTCVSIVRGFACGTCMYIVCIMCMMGLCVYCVYVFSLGGMRINCNWLQVKSDIDVFIETTND